jgi:hypothetical protein
VGNARAYTRRRIPAPATRGGFVGALTTFIFAERYNNGQTDLQLVVIDLDSGKPFYQPVGCVTVGPVDISGMEIRDRNLTARIITSATITEDGLMTISTNFNTLCVASYAIAPFQSQFRTRSGIPNGPSYPATTYMPQP